MIQREAVFPYTFPRELGTLLSYAMNNRRDVVYHLSALPRLAPWLFRYWQSATPERVERTARALAPLMARCVDEHEALIAEEAAHRPSIEVGDQFADRLVISSGEKPRGWPTSNRNGRDQIGISDRLAPGSAAMIRRVPPPPLGSVIALG